MAKSQTFSAGCSKVGSFSYAGNFTLYVQLTDRDGNSSTNKSIVDFNVFCQSSGSGSINARHALYFELNGAVYRNETLTVNVSSPNAYIHIASGSVEIEHTSDGSKSISFGASIQAASYGVAASVSNTFALEKIPRYTTVYNSERGKTLNSISVNWSTTDARDWTQYSLNGGAWTDANDAVSSDNKSGYYTISGLSPNTTYNVKTRCRRTDSQLWSESGSINIKTYQIATITEAPDFTDEANPTIKYTNPFGNNVSTLMACISLTGVKDDIGYRDINKTGTEYTFNLTEAERNVLRKAASSKNSLSITFFVKTTYGTSIYYSTVKKTVNIINSNPTFSNFTYQDTNDTTIALTGSNQTIVKGYSNVKGIVSVANKAIANKKAEMDYYRLSIGEQTTEIDYSNTAEVSGTINAVNSNTFSMYAVDSRNNSTVKTITASKYINYSEIAITSITAVRTNSVNSETTLKFSGKIWDGSFGSVSNKIKECYYRYKLTTSNTWSSNINITPTKSGSTFSFNSIIKGDLAAEGFDIDNSYNIQVFIKDELSNNYSNPASFILGPGTPAVAIYKNNVAIGQRYDTSDDSKLQVRGATKTDKLLTTELITARSFLFKMDALSASDSDRYYKIAKLPATSEANAAFLNIKGTIGGWGANKATIDMQITNRDSIRVYANYIGAKSAFLPQQIVIYKESDGTHTVYLKNAATYYIAPVTFNITWGYFSTQKITIYTDYSYITSPTGTLEYTSTEQTVGDANGGVVLFENSSGTAGTITLNVNFSNFKYIKVYYHFVRSPGGTNYNISDSIEFQGNATKFAITEIIYKNENTGIKGSSTLYSISGASIVIYHQHEWEFDVGGTFGYNDINSVKITKIVGHY